MQKNVWKADLAPVCLEAVQQVKGSLWPSSCVIMSQKMPRLFKYSWLLWMSHLSGKIIQMYSFIPLGEKGKIDISVYFLFSLLFHWCSSISKSLKKKRPIKLVNVMKEKKKRYGKNETADKMRLFECALWQWSNTWGKMHVNLVWWEMGLWSNSWM